MVFNMLYIQVPTKETKKMLASAQKVLNIKRKANKEIMSSDATRSNLEWIISEIFSEFEKWMNK
jgi:hypothetical protein